MYTWELIMSLCKKSTLILCISLYAQPTHAVDLNWLLNTRVGKQCNSLYQQTRTLFNQHPILAPLIASSAGTVLLVAASIKAYNLYQQRKEAESQLARTQQAIKYMNGLLDRIKKQKNIDLTDPNTFIESTESTDYCYGAAWLDFQHWVIRPITEQTIPADITGDKDVTPLFILVKMIDPFYVNHLYDKGTHPDPNKETTIILPDGSFDTPHKAAERIPETSYSRRKKKAAILARFGYKNLLDDIKSDQHRYENKLKLLESDRPAFVKMAVVGIQQMINEHRVDQDFQLPNLNNRTALHIAAQTNNKTLGQWLYDRHASTSIEDAHGDTVIDIASEVLEKLPQEERKQQFAWKLLTQEYGRALDEQCKERQSGVVVPGNFMPGSKRGKNPFDIIKQQSTTIQFD